MSVSVNADNVWFTSDLHFFHANIIAFCDRPFQDVEDMNRYLIEFWNATVPKNGVVFVLGDVAFKGVAQTAPLVAQLNGTKHLIRGNHDGRKFDALFESAHDYLEVHAQSATVRKKLVLCHYPITSWHNMHHGWIHLHGHCHGSLKEERYGRLDVGVDCHGLKPISLARVLELVRQQPAPQRMLPVDHHQLGDQ